MYREQTYHHILLFSQAFHPDYYNYMITKTAITNIISNLHLCVQHIENQLGEKAPYDI